MSLSTLMAQYEFSGVFVNNQPINQYQYSMLQQLTGSLRAGYYYMDNRGNFGVVGYRPFVNLYQAYQTWAAKQQTNQSNYYGNNQQASGNSNREYYRKSGTGYSWSDGKGNSGYKSDILDTSISRSGKDFIINLGGGTIYSNF